ncbi:MAG: hypothetical protein K6V97_11355 [Actinomycetia bacterium]|nr:hypothetical protein [Actinomycetes bacterium]
MERPGVAAAYDTPRAAVDAMAAAIGYTVRANRGGWVRFWNPFGTYAGKVQGWPAAYRVMAGVYSHSTGRPAPRVRLKGGA